MKNKASIEIQIPLSLSYSLIYQGEASPLKGSSHPCMRWCVPILTPSPSIYRPGSPRENTPSTTGMPLGSNGETTPGRRARTALRWGRSTCGVDRSWVGSVCAAFRLGDCQVGPQGGSRCMGWLEAVYSGVVGPCILVLNKWQCLICWEVLLLD
jgi:hypothetical protein